MRLGVEIDFFERDRRCHRRSRSKKSTSTGEGRRQAGQGLAGACAQGADEQPVFGRGLTAEPSVESLGGNVAVQGFEQGLDEGGVLFNEFGVDAMQGKGAQVAALADSGV